MAKRDPKRDSQPDGSARSRQRGKPVQIQAKKPVGTIVGVTLLALALVGVLVYAVANTGGGFTSALDQADQGIEGVTVADEESLSRNHVEGPVDYEQKPPNGGDHNGQWQTCAVYDEPIATERAVHSLEHGAVWITYKSTLPADQVEALKDAAEGRDYVLMSPYDEQSADINLSAWGRRLTPTSATDERIEEFIDAYANGPQTPEKGASCIGVSETGPLPGAPAPAAPAGPSAAPAS